MRMQVVPTASMMNREKLFFPYGALLLCLTLWLSGCRDDEHIPVIPANEDTRTDTLIPQLRNDKPVDEKLVNLGFWLIILGLLKKGLIADYIADYNNWICTQPALPR